MQHNKLPQGNVARQCVANSALSVFLQRADAVWAEMDYAVLSNAAGRGSRAPGRSCVPVSTTMAIRGRQRSSEERAQLCVAFAPRFGLISAG